MSASFGAVLRESLGRLRSAAGAAFIGLLLAISVVSTAADHSQTSPFDGINFEELREDLLSEVESDEEAEFVNSAVDFAADFVDRLVAAQNVFDLGISDTLASSIGFLIWIPLAVVVLGGLRVIAEQRDQFDTSAFDNLAWNFLNLVGGVIGISIAAVIGSVVLLILTSILLLIPFVGVLLALLLWVIVPIAVGALLFYWMPAIAVDNENALEAVKTSYTLARENYFATFGLVALYGVFQLGSFFLFLWLLYNTSAAVTASTNLVLGVLFTGLVLAWMGTGYDLAKKAHETAADGPADDTWGGNDRLGDNPGASADETWNRDTDTSNESLGGGDTHSDATDETWDTGTRSDTTEGDDT